jgi:hypothetical protein
MRKCQHYQVIPLPHLEESSNLLVNLADVVRIAVDMLAASGHGDPRRLVTAESLLDLDIGHIHEIVGAGVGAREALAGLCMV